MFQPKEMWIKVGRNEGSIIVCSANKSGYNPTSCIRHNSTPTPHPRTCTVGASDHSSSCVTGAPVMPHPAKQEPLISHHPAKQGPLITPHPA